MTENTGQQAPATDDLPGNHRPGLKRKLLRSGIAWRFLAPVNTVVYRWYARLLLADVKSHPLPNHVAMILDGNRRFARRWGLSDPSEGHRYGADKVTEVVKWCDELSIPVVTIWGLSTDNLSRDPDELSNIFEIVGERLEALCEEHARSGSKRRVRAVGRLELLPEDLQRRVRRAEDLTAKSGPHLLNVAVAYGGRDEVLDAIRRMLRAKSASGESALEIAEKLRNEDLQTHLYAPDMPEPDLIIRTSGEVRLSGFLLWQSVYSELYFCDAPWPAFRNIDFLRAIRSFQQRRRRYGH